MNLQLERPIAFLDIEATGVNVRTERIIDLAVIKVHPDGQQSNHYWRVNPGKPIPPEASGLHGILDKDVAGKLSFKAVAGEIASVLKECDLGGFGIVRFDVPLLQAEFARNGIEFTLKGRALVDALAVFHQRERRDLQAAVRFYLKEDLPKAHRAVDDTVAALRVLEAQLARYPDLPTEVRALDLLCNPKVPNRVDESGKLVWVGDEAAINFGKYSGTTLRALAKEDPGYFDWILSKDFPSDVKEIVREAKAGRFPGRPSIEPDTFHTNTSDDLPF